MGKWFDKIINKLWGVDITTERAEHETSDTERKVRDLRRRIEEQKRAIGYYTTQSNTAQRTREIQKETSSLGAAREEKNAELNALKEKLMGKKL